MTDLLLMLCTTAMTTAIHGLVRFLKRYRKMAAEHMFTDVLQCLASPTTRCRSSVFIFDDLQKEGWYWCSITLTPTSAW